MNTEKFNDFIIQENQEPSIRGYLEQILSNVDQISPKSQRDQERISIIKQHILEIRRLVRRQEMQQSLATKPETSTESI